MLFLEIGSLTQALLEFELQSFFGRRRMEREIGRLDGSLHMCGAGRVGRSVARELARRPAPFVIIDAVHFAQRGPIKAVIDRSHIVFLQVGAFRRNQDVSFDHSCKTQFRRYRRMPQFG